MSVEAVDALIAQFDQEAATVEDLKEQEARLRAADTTKERQKLTREAEKFDAIRTHLETVHAALAGDALTVLQEQRSRVTTLQEAAEVLARSFELGPLLGVGSSPWKELWESARRYSETHAYSDKGFPVLDPASRCVLCQQTLDPGATDRLSRFERFVRDDTQVRLQEAREAYDKQARSLTKLVVSSEAVATNLTDLEVGDADLVNETRKLLGRYEAARTTVVATLGESGDVQVIPIEPEATMARLREAAAKARATAESLSNPTVLSAKLAAVTTKRKELELLHKSKGARAAIVA